MSYPNLFVFVPKRTTRNYLGLGCKVGGRKVRFGTKTNFTPTNFISTAMVGVKLVRGCKVVGVQLVDVKYGSPHSDLMIEKFARDIVSCFVVCCDYVVHSDLRPNSVITCVLVKIFRCGKRQRLAYNQALPSDNKTLSWAYDQSQKEKTTNYLLYHLFYSLN